jgi:hypothetical protein
MASLNAVGSTSTSFDALESRWATTSTTAT